MEWRIQIEKTNVQIMKDKVESVYSGKIVSGFEYMQRMNKRFFFYPPRFNSWAYEIN